MIREPRFFLLDRTTRRSMEGVGRVTEAVPIEVRPWQSPVGVWQSPASSVQCAVQPVQSAIRADK
jgi:hypothetical protein